MNGSHSTTQHRQYFNQHNICKILPFAWIILKSGLGTSGYIIQNFFPSDAKFEALWHKQVLVLAGANLKAGGLALINRNGVCGQETQMPPSIQLAILRKVILEIRF